MVRAFAGDSTITSLCATWLLLLLLRVHARSVGSRPNTVARPASRTASEASGEHRRGTPPIPPTGATGLRPHYPNWRIGPDAPVPPRRVL